MNKNVQGKRIINVFSIKLPQSWFPGSKSRNNALYADFCKATIELPVHAVATIRVFLPREPFLRAKLFIMQLPCKNDLWGRDY